jgi:hypothetical protein
MRRLPLILTTWLIVTVASTIAATPPASVIYDTLNRKHLNGLTYDDVKKYLAEYDPRFNFPPYIQFAQSNAAFRKVMEDQLDAAAADVMLKGIRNGRSNDPRTFVVPKRDFISFVNATNPGVPKEKQKDYLAEFSKSVSRDGSFLSDSKLTIAKSTTVAKDTKNPAQFSWSRTPKESAFTIDAAVSYSYDIDFPFNLQLGSYQLSGGSINPAVEAHTSTSSTKQQDSLSAKLPIVLAFSSTENSNWLETGLLAISPIYETDRKKETESYGVDIFWSPILRRPIQTGQAIGLDAVANTLGFSYKGDYPAFDWMPYVGFENGYAYAASGSVYDNGHQFSRFVLRLHGDIYFTPRFSVAIDYYHRNFLTGKQDWFDFVDISPLIYLDGDPFKPDTQHFSIGMSFKFGETTPQFQEVNSIGAWIGVKF